MVYTKYEWVDGELMTAEKLNNSQDLLLGAVDEKINETINKTINYKMVSLTLNINKDIETECFEKISSAGSTTALVVMSPITSATDPNPTMQSVDRITSAIQTANINGAPVTMLKPHLGTYDDFDRSTYNPSSYDMFFSNWTTHMLQYAKICNDNNVPILSIGCEQLLTTSNDYTDKWLSLITEIREQYPNLKLTYAMSRLEFTQLSHTEMFEYLDYIGMNVYPSYTDKEFTNDMTVYDLVGGWYQSRSNGVNFQSIVDILSETYNKPVLLTEIGGMPYVNVLNATYVGDGHYTISYDALAKYIEVSYYIAKNSKNIVGLSWWHGEFNGTFSLWKSGEVTASESMLQKMNNEV